MSTDVLVLGIDPGFASIGIALVRLLPESEEIEYLGLIRTEKSSAKRKVLAADDNFQRSRLISRRLIELMDRGVSLVCAESMSFPRNASAAAKMSLCWGALAALAELRQLPVVQASPSEIKKKVCGEKTASKEDVEAAMVRRYGGGVEKFLNASGVTKTTREHPVDALAAVVACLDSEVVRMARRVSSARN